MNKAITDGVIFMPTAFDDGLDVWSSGDGTPGSETYAGATNAAYVPADQDFAGCIELQKTETVHQLRYMGETPILPGCYLRVTARVKAVSGNLPSVRIAGWAGDAGGAHVSGLTEAGPTVTLTNYGQVTEVSAIIGTGTRTGVDMVWPSPVVMAHLGLDLTGANGGVVRIDDIVIEDVTNVFLRSMMDWVDVRDYGAVGDGVTDDSAAFEAADNAANGREILVSEGTYYLASNVTIDSPIRFAGTLVMPETAMLSLTKSYDLPTYIDAFGDDEELAFRKAFQALLNNSAHESLDMGGRRVGVSGPIDMQAAVNNRTEYATRRQIMNGQFYAEDTSNWDTEIFTSVATYSSSNSTVLTDVVNVANIPVGAHVTANGVGREVYVTGKNVSLGQITLSMPLYDAVGTQSYTFTRYKYLLDFTGFSKLSRFVISDVEFQCAGRSSAIILAPSGHTFAVKDCFITTPKDRGISSIGTGCQGMLIDRCQFLSDQGGVPAQDRTSVALNANGNDVKLRDNRITKFRHFAVLAGTSSIVIGNHWFQGDNQPDGLRTAGLVLTSSHNRATVTGNYVDNCSIEWTNEHHADPSYENEFSFSALTISDNIFQSIGAAPWTRFIIVKPYGPDHYISGLNITGNIFRSIHGVLDRVEAIDTSFADMNYERMRNILIKGNMFNNIGRSIENPRVLSFEQTTASDSWSVDCSQSMAFDGLAQNVVSVVTDGPIVTAGNNVNFDFPHILTEAGVNRDRVDLRFSEPVRGAVTLAVRMDNF